MRRSRLLVLIALLASGCGLTTHVRPIAKGAVEVEGAVGGPLVNAGVLLPLPLATVGAAWGFADRWDAQAHAHLTPLAVNVVGVDGAATWLALEQRRFVPAVALTGRLYLFTDLAAALLPYGELAVTASWSVGARTLVFASVSGAAVYDGTFSWSPAAGARVNLGRWSLQGDLRWYAPSDPTRYSSAGFVGPGGQGGLGVVVGAGYLFGG